MSFLDDSYLLSGHAAAAIYGEIADLPILDAHNHADVRRIAENVPFANPWELFAATDHYVWEIERKCGVPEDRITGSCPDREKWNALCRVFPLMAGNPLYEWMHLDLRFLGFDDLISEKTASRLWDGLCIRLAEDSCRPQNLIRRMNIETMCSTDDPIDTLEWHRIANHAFGKMLIRPTWRPDKAMNIAKPGWSDYVDRLGKRFGVSMNSIDGLLDALRLSHDFFAESGAVASDHGLEKPYDGKTEAAEADAVFRKVRSGALPTAAETDAFASFLLARTAELDAEKDWVFQMHIGAVRDVRTSLYRSLGPDSGGDISDHSIDLVHPLIPFLDRFDGRLKTVLYCLEPGHQASLAALSRAFGSTVRLGSAWWLNDTPIGMRRQLEYIGSIDVFSKFAGMVSDSRKLLSYSSRFQMFRRVLSDVLGTMVDRGQMPPDIAAETARRMCYEEPKCFFRFAKNKQD